MARSSWFDPQTHQAGFGEWVEQMDSWQQALAYGTVDADELQAQAQRVTDLLRALEPELSDALHEKLTVVFRELAVLYGMQRLAEITMNDQEG